MPKLLPRQEPPPAVPTALPFVPCCGACGERRYFWVTGPPEPQRIPVEHLVSGHRVRACGRCGARVILYEPNDG